MNVGAASFEGTDRFGGVNIRFIRSQTWSVGVLVTDARRCSGNRVPGGSILPRSAFANSSRDHNAPTRPETNTISRSQAIWSIGRGVLGGPSPYALTRSLSLLPILNVHFLSLADRRVF